MRTIQPARNVKRLKNLAAKGHPFVTSSRARNKGRHLEGLERPRANSTHHAHALHPDLRLVSRRARTGVLPQAGKLIQVRTTGPR
jgi:hypothetical protein